MNVVQRRSFAQTPLSQKHAAIFIEIAERLSGNRITPDQVDFLTLRVRRRMRVHRDESFEGYIRRVQDDQVEEHALMESLVTHTTDFFREPAHFKWLRNGGLNRLSDGKPASCLNVWSAACSLGSELWSTAIEIAQFQEDAGVPYCANLVGTDISKTILARAKAAIFSAEEISGLPAQYRSKYLQRNCTENQKFRIAAPLLESASFVAHNLLTPPLFSTLQFDLALLRNVLLYFNKDDQQRVFNHVLSRLRPGGILMIGHTEVLSIETIGTKRVGPAIFIKE
ncbi:protein-glutamate O-methyltransferase CheR [Falsihalocynthiibacter sp. S25ZX9]|uniref:CheR family methyltransferase n=1 Tax=Falsihalocynthiibacter sp. S25ZX9 TaxID=3240870 RepID=UPI00350F8DF1